MICPELLTTNMLRSPNTMMSLWKPEVMSKGEVQCETRTCFPVPRFPLLLRALNSSPAAQAETFSERDNERKETVWKKVNQDCSKWSSKREVDDWHFLPYLYGTGEDHAEVILRDAVWFW